MCPLEVDIRDVGGLVAAVRQPNEPPPAQEPGVSHGTSVPAGAGDILYHHGLPRWRQEVVTLPEPTLRRWRCVMPDLAGRLDIFRYVAADKAELYRAIMGQPVEARELQSAALGDIHELLRELEALASEEGDPDAGKVHRALNLLCARLEDLTSRARAFLGSVQRAIDLHGLAVHEKAVMEFLLRDLEGS